MSSPEDAAAAHGPTMPAPSPVTCDFCLKSDTNEITGELQRTPDGRIVAHYNCMLYSPKVIKEDPRKDEEGFDFKIDSLQKELERGKHLRCNICKRTGATVGCNVKSCKKNYHFPCAIQAKGSPREDCFMYCALHKYDNGSKDDGSKTKSPMKRTKKKKSLDMAGKPRNNNIEKQRNNNAIMESWQMYKQSDDDVIYINSSTEIEENEEAVPSTSGQHGYDKYIMSSRASAEDTDFMQTPKADSVFFHSGLSKSKEEDSSNGKPNEMMKKMTAEENELDSVVSQPTTSDSAEKDKTTRLLTHISYDHMKTKDPMCQEQSKSITSKRKLCLDIEKFPSYKRVPKNEENLPEQMEAPEKQNEYYTENEMPASVESEHGAEHQSGPSRMDIPARSQLYGPLCRSKSWSGFQHKRAGYRDSIDGFGEAVAGCCRLMPKERQARYMNYVCYSADLFSTAQPEFHILINSLQTVFERSKQSTP